MTEEKAKRSSENLASKSFKKKFSLTRVAVLFVIIFSGYLGLRYFEIKQSRKLSAKAEVGKFDNIESEIFDLGEEYKNQLTGDSHDPHGLSDLPLNAVQENGAEFIYKMLLKNQSEINDLKQQTQFLKSEFTKYKNQEKLGKLILSYVDFRQKLLVGLSGEDELKNFEMLAAYDQNLQDKVSKLKPLLKTFASREKLTKDLASLIPEIIATKNSGAQDAFFAKVRHNISKLITIRRIDGKNPDDVDGIIVRTEKLLHDANYQEAFDSLMALDASYHAILADFLSELSTTVEVRKIDSEILSYLKTLSS